MLDLSETLFDLIFANVGVDGAVVAAALDRFFLPVGPVPGFDADILELMFELLVSAWVPLAGHGGRVLPLDRSLIFLPGTTGLSMIIALLVPTIGSVMGFGWLVPIPGGECLSI